jgi:hypothetical protein
MSIERRRQLARREACLSRAAQSVEVLESRVLLATMTSTPFAPDVLGFKDAHDHRMRITVTGNTTAEFIFADVDEDTNVLTLRDQPVPAGSSTNGADLFKIYVRNADESSTIAVYEVDEQGNPTPYNGNAGSIRVTNAQNGMSISVSPGGNTGAGWLGARTKDIPDVDNEEDIPILTKRLGSPTAIGVHPAVRTYRAGLEVADGQDLGKFLFGGTISGWVDAGGSINTFYAGSILTGETRGQTEGPPDFRNNFIVDGDLRDLIVRGSIGTTEPTATLAPTYVTGFEARITGKVGQIWTQDSLLGSVNVLHAGGISDRLAASQGEIEARSNPQNGRMFPQGLLNDASFNNDTFDSPQYLGSLRAKRGGGRIELVGELDATNPLADYTDYYAVALRAGQEVVVQLSSLPLIGVVDLGIFDPDGRLVATDHDNIDPTAVNNRPFMFKADRPGIYRFAVATFRDADFNGAGGEFGIVNIGPTPYTLLINGVGDLGLGGVVAGDNLSDVQIPPLQRFDPIGYHVAVQNGDLGAAFAGANILSQSDHTFWVRNGNLRVIESPNVGTDTNNQLGAGSSVVVPRGDVGLLRSTAGPLVINDKNNADPSLGGTLVPPIGGTYQVVDAAGALYAQLIANGDIGVIRGDHITTLDPGWFQVNADNAGKAGRIDLIDITNDFGTLPGGGPPITTGPGGNVRYIRVGGLVFRDRFFGGGVPEDTLYRNTEEVKFFDDSGSRVTIRPSPKEPNPNFVFGGTNSRFLIPDLNVVTYGIRGSGGVALINVESSASLDIAVSGTRKGATAEIGRIATNGPGAPITLQPGTDFPVMTPVRGPGFAQTNIGTAHFARFNGSARMDVFEIVGGEMSEITNNTGGEIVSVTATSVGTIRTSGTLGLARHSTLAVVEPRAVIANTFPFVNQKIGIRAGSMVSIRAAGGVGNIISTGNIGEVIANSNGRAQGDGQFEGINAPVTTTGRIFNVGIGQGVLYSGSGNVGKSGIYADLIDNVSGKNADIRGTISAINGIGRIGLTNGSLINAEIMVPTDHSMTREFENIVTLTDVPGTNSVNAPKFEIGLVSVSGQNSGIIGSEITAADIENIRSRGGFGMINSGISGVGDSVINSIVVGGLGIRGSTIQGGASIHALVVEGKSRNVNVRGYSPRVRFSENHVYDPYFGTEVNRVTDLHMYLGTSKTQGKLKRITDTAVIEDSIVNGQRDLGRVETQQIRGETQFAFANIIGDIWVKNQIAGMSLTSGRLDLLRVDGNASAMDVTVAGPIKTVNIARLYAANSVVKAQGPQGTMGTFSVGTDMAGDVLVQGSFDFLKVGHDLEATSLVRAKSLNRREIGGNIFGTIQIG